MCQNCGWEKFANEIEDRLQDRRYDFASKLLGGILVTVRTRKHATDGQTEAVANVDKAVDR